MEIKTLEKLYILQLKDIYSGERQLIAALPKMIKSASNKYLKIILKGHLEDAKLHSLRIEDIFKKIKSNKPGGENCNAIEGFIEEFENLLEEGGEPDEIDASVINIIQKIAHFAIASYSSLVTYAKMIGEERAIELLQTSLDEEYEVDNRLDKLFEEIINIFVKN